MLPAPYQDERGIYRLYYKLSSFPVLVDILRNEKPVHLHFWKQGTENNTHISTMHEATGEAEL